MSDRPTASQRERRSEGESRPPDTEVITTRTGAANSGYAYHDIDEDGTPRCGAGGSPREFERILISEARRRQKAPCKVCQRLRE
jgi:hypothetical protein